MIREAKNDSFSLLSLGLWPKCQYTTHTHAHLNELICHACSQLKRNRSPRPATKRADDAKCGERRKPHESVNHRQQRALIDLWLQGDLVIQKTETVLSGRLFGESTQQETLLKDVIDAIDHAQSDKRIQVLVLDLQDMRAAGISKLQDIGEALTRF